MCEHCGCRGVEPIAELMDEHLSLLDLAGDIRRALSNGDRTAAVAHLEVLARHLTAHVRREEAGVFTALKNQGDFVEEVDTLEAEHVSFDEAVAGLDPSASGFEDAVARLLRELDDHVERENLGIFPVSVVTLGATGWDTVNAAHQASPSFLHHRHPLAG
ncbi:MAG: hemerythrin domain-containing protein [Nocardioidaceae bacterium]